MGKLWTQDIPIRVVLYVVLSVLAGFVWAWAYGANLWDGIVPGAVLGLAAGIFVPRVLAEGYKRGGFDSLGAMLLGVVVIGFLLAFSAVGAIVGLIIRWEF